MMQQMLVGMGGPSSPFADGVVYAYSGDGTITDATGNGNVVANYWQYGSERKWGELQ